MSGRAGRRNIDVVGYAILGTLVAWTITYPLRNRED